MDLGLHCWNFSNPSDPAEIAATQLTVLSDRRER
ncbi:MAG: hypothetical protein JWR11_2575 [Mycobacterium sp.]|nr:hypothetical protein [Mycobacterium sp.]